MTHKIKAYQTPPEWQEWPLADCFPVNIAVFGNRHMEERTFDLFDKVREALDNGEPLQDTPEWYDLLDRYHMNPTGSDNAFLCEALTLETGRTWNNLTLRGCCQGDWQYMIYPIDQWTLNALREFETMYWNTGTQWTADGIYIYCTAWNSDDIRQQIADALEADPENIILYAFDGWTKTPKYKKENK